MCCFYWPDCRGKCSKFEKYRSLQSQSNFLRETVISGRSRIISSLTRNMEIAPPTEWPLFAPGRCKSEREATRWYESSRTGRFRAAFITGRFCRQGYSSLNVLTVPARYFQHDTFVPRNREPGENATLHPSCVISRHRISLQRTILKTTVPH